MGRGALFGPWAEVLARAETWRRDQVADVLHLARDPARDVVGPHDLARTLVAAPLFVLAHHDRLVHRVRGRLDLEPVHGQHVVTQLFRGPHAPGPHAHPPAHIPALP